MIPRPKPERFRLRRTMMFMNAQKPGLIKDAYIYGVDSIMLDLEDAVAENQKDAARFSLYHALKTIDYGDTEVAVLRQIKLMRKLGVPLDFPVTEVSVNGKTAYSVGEDCLLLVCLTPDIQPEDVEQMAEYAPAKAVISRDSFADDTAMANAWYILRDRGVDLKLV